MSTPAHDLCRRAFLRRAWNGFGMLPFTHLLWQEGKRSARENRASDPVISSVVYPSWDMMARALDTFPLM